MRTRRPPGKPGALLARAAFLVLLAVALAAGEVGAQSHPGSPASPWLYLRDGQPLTSDEHPVELVAVGDIMLGRGVQVSAETLAHVAPELEKADLAVGNFEGVLAPAGTDPALLSTNTPGSPIKLVMSREAPVLLRKAGFDLVSLANNHALDLHASGLLDTVQGLQSAGIQVFGVADKPSSVAGSLFMERRGLRIAFLAFSMVPTPGQPEAGPLPARYEPQAAAASVAAARQAADVVVVVLHGGVEYQPFADPAQERAARHLAQAGADLVLGAHPHVVQGIQLLLTQPPGGDALKESFIAYSLGNFVFDQFKDETINGLALRIYLDRQGLRAVEALPLRAGAHPRWLDSLEAQDPLERLQAQASCVSLPATAWFSCQRSGCQPAAAAFAVARADGGRFRSGEIDLTGDGQAERVRLSDGKVEIIQDNRLVWSSPQEWQVLDLVLGDPNHDGRSEALLSLRKKDTSQVERSHPFIVGYRRGVYKLLWGGSALSTPIGEVELGDVDGDGSQELVVLEDQPGGDRTISVWRWHGWGFSLEWRSDPGAYENLRLSISPGNPESRIQTDQACRRDWLILSGNNEQ